MKTFDTDMHEKTEADVILSVVLPCLNEAKTLEKAIGTAAELISSTGMKGEIVLSDNGSTDGSREIAERAGARVVSAERKGYGFALMSGIRAARGSIIVMGDADATYDFREAKQLVEAVDAGADLAMGSRLRGNIEEGAMPYLHRHLGTPVLTWLIRRFFGLSITDCNCGMRAFSKKAFERMDLISGGMEFASEMLIKAALCGMKVVEYPISLLKDTRDRAPHLHTWRDGWRHLRFILIFAPHVTFFIPGMVLFILFGIETLLLSFGVVTVGAFLFDYHHLFYSVPLFIIGYQMLWFARLSEQFRNFSGYDTVQRHRYGKFNMELWLLVGVAMAIGGLAIFGIVFASWIASGHGELFAIRRGVAGLALLLLGVTTIMNSFMMSMLELNLDRGAGGK